MTELDVERFWHDNSIAHPDPFGAQIPQTPMSLDITHYAMFAEVGVEEDNWRLEHDYEWTRACAKAYNDRAERIVGRRLLNESAFDPARRFPAVRSVAELFECRRVWKSDSWWTVEAASSPGELEALLDRVEKLDIEAEMFPADWESECRRLYEQHGLRPVLPRNLRAPITLATSIYGTENLIYLLLDEPGLAARFRDAIIKVLIDYYTICLAHTDPAKRYPGFSFLDDNCYLMTPDMYAFFGQPILQAVYDRFAPAPEDCRYQHSDSDMGHLLPLLAETGMNRVNFGPNVRFSAIRRTMPKAVVLGTLAPFTLMRNDEAGIEREVRRDLEEARDTRGLIVATAGSVNNGSRLSSVRRIMQTIVDHGRYARLDLSPLTHGSP